MQVKPEVTVVGTQTLPVRRNSYESLDDATLLYFTGLERERFLIIFRSLERFNPIEERLLWTKKDALMITLYKCRHNLDFKMMEFMFDISRKLISKIFTDVIDKL